MNTQPTHSLVIVLFLVTLAGPPLFQVVVEARHGEWPAALEIFKQLPTTENLRAYEKELEDASVTARTLRPVMQSLQFFLLREAGEKAFVGPHGWLFYQPGVSYLTQRAKPDDSTVQDAMAAVSRFRKDLAARGIHLIVMPAPNKESVYPDQLAHCAAPPTQVLSEETRAFLAQCAAAGVEVVDLFALYRNARTSSLMSLYLEQDSHWSPVGVELAAKAVAAHIIERGWLAPGTISYDARPSPVEELGDIVRMIRSPQVEARLKPQFIPTSQVIRRDTNALFTDDPSPEILVLGDSFLRIYERDAPGGAGFVAHLARALGCPVAGIINDGGASTLVRQELFRRPRLLARAKVVVWEFVERDIRLGTKGWQIVPLPALNADPQPVLHASPRPAADRPSVDLSGEWEFKLDPLDVGRAEKWFMAREPYQRKIRVPGAWNAQGIAFESEKQLRAYEEKRLQEQKALNERGILGVQRESDRLFHTYPGPGWYRRKTTIPADWKGKIPWLVFTGVHRNAEVWVNGKLAGTHRSYLTPFRIDLSQSALAAKPGDTIRIDVRVDARRNPETDPLLGCLDTLDFLYVTWGGIHQPVKLEATSPTRVEDVFIVPKLADKSAEIRVAIAGPRNGKLEIAAEVRDEGGTTVSSLKQPVGDGAAETVLSAPIEKPKLWSPKSPHLYTVQVRLLSGGAAIDEKILRFGMREFKVSGEQFLLNGRPIFLRGYGEDAIFPNTICPPTDKEELRARLTRARDYGFNFVRHHSWTPPESYLEAADELGMMLQPEFPFAYRWDLPSTPETRRAAHEQWEAIIRLNRNHPSIVAWCMGNELYDSFDIAAEMYQAAKRLDSTRPVIDSDGCRFQHRNRKTLDYLVVQFDEGQSIGYEDNKYKIPASITKPVIAHEMGYFATLHDLAQIDNFKSGLRSYWLSQTRGLAEKKKLLGVYPGWLAASYHLQATCLKSNMEAARRSRLAGTSVWLFQDYPNCAEGVVSMFGQPKGLSAEEFRTFNAPTVLLLDAPRRNWWSGEAAEIRFIVSRFEDEPSDAATLRWQLKSGNETLAEGKQSRIEIRSGAVQQLPAIKLEIPKLARAAKLRLRAELADTNGATNNSWHFWVFPRDSAKKIASDLLVAGFDPIRAVYPKVVQYKDGLIPAKTRLLVTARLDENITRYLKEGGRVFLLDPEPVFAVEKTNFRLASWDGGGPSGTILDPRHPALREMPTDGWCDLQFYPLVQNSKTALLTPLPAKIEPLLRCIDRPTRLADRAYLFEVSIGRGKLLVSSFNFAQALTMNDPAGIFCQNFVEDYRKYTPTAWGEIVKSALSDHHLSVAWLSLLIHRMTLMEGARPRGRCRRAAGRGSPGARHPGAILRERAGRSVGALAVHRDGAARLWARRS
jgi:hypothetical protein